MNQQTERWQGASEQGELTDESVTREAAANGALHLSAHVWFWRHDDQNGLEILLQKRAATKRTWPNYFDISAAGHVDFAEPTLNAALRETKEELGLTLSKNDLKLLFVYRQNFVDEDSGIIENEFQWVYGYQAISNIDPVFTDKEVESIVWVRQKEFQAMAAGETSEQLVPQGKAYFTNLLAAIEREAKL